MEESNIMFKDLGLSDAMLKALEKKGVQCEIALDASAHGSLFEKHGYSWHKISVPHAGGHSATKLSALKGAVKLFTATFKARSLIKKLEVDFVVGVLGGGAIVASLGGKVARKPTFSLISTPLDSKVCPKFNHCYILPELDKFRWETLPKNMDKAFYPDDFVVPFIQIVHDRAVQEVFRGCIRGCRFCQAGFLNRPLRSKSPEVVEAQCKAICDSTGYDEISLCSLSTSDYKGLETLIKNMLPWTIDEKINIALPSLRVDNFPKELMEKLNAVRRSGLTFAPEAGTQRLRDVINKNITEEEVLKTAAQALPSETSFLRNFILAGVL